MKKSSTLILALIAIGLSSLRASCADVSDAKINSWMQSNTGFEKNYGQIFLAMGLFFCERRTQRQLQNC